MEQLQDPKQILVQISHSKNQSLISVKVPESETRTPSDISLVIDTSGSMGCEATMKNNNGQSESYGLNQLDLVKHAGKTVIHNLQPCDRLSIIEFNSHAKVVFPLTKMDENGQKKAIEKLEALQDNGSTNLWEGLKTGLDELRKNSEKNRNQAVFLLTDGQPNDIPKEGNVGALQNYKKQYEQFSCIINTYGFGYSLQSEELNQLSLIGGGAYGFIPDSSLVGSIFINALSNFLSIADYNTTLNIEPLNGAEFDKKQSIIGYNYESPSWGVSVNLEQILYGQTKSVVVNLQLPENANDQTEYLLCKVIFGSNKNLKDVQKQVKNDQISQDIQKQIFRVLFVEIIDEVMKLQRQNKESEAQKAVENLINQIKSENSLNNDKYLQGLDKDLEGQVAMAVSKAEFYNKWGIHFLPSLQRAHQIQQCNNFKDAGVQNYGGLLFQKLRDQADETFNKLPPPKPSIQHENVQQIQNMQVYNDPYGGCVGGETLVKMFDGRILLAKDIKKGDIVLSSENKPAVVKATIQIKITKGKKNLVQLEEGLIITPWHPVRINNQWQFPCYLSATVERKIDCVYNFVLESEHVMIINNVECVTLGHNFKGDVIEHAYFGSQLIIDDLSNQQGWKEGFVQIQDTLTQRNKNTKLITSMIHHNTNFQNISTLI